MTRYLSGRLLGAAATVLGVSIIAFMLLRVLPGDPVRLALGRLASQDAVDAQRIHMGLDQPLVVQYWRYITDFFSGNWGFAYSMGAPTQDLIVQRLPATVELGVVAFVLAFVAALFAVLISTYRRRPWLDSTVRGVAYVGLGTPPFWFALLLLLLFSQQLAIFPGPEGRLSAFAAPPPHVTGLYLVDSLLVLDFATFGDALLHLVLPAIALGFAPFALLTRILRANMLETSRDPFVVVARSLGNGRWRAHTHHVLPNAFLPTLTISGILLAELLVGSVLIERIFGWPGVGALAIDAISRQEYSVIQVFILLSAVGYVLVNVLVDVLSSLIDPRIRTQLGAAR